MISIFNDIIHIVNYNKNDKIKQKLFILIMPPRSNNSNTDKLNFNKENWITLREILSQNQQIVLIDFNLILLNFKELKLVEFCHW